MMELVRLNLNSPTMQIGCLRFFFLHLVSASVRCCEWILCSRGHAVYEPSIHQSPSEGLNDPMRCGASGCLPQGKVGLCADTNTGLVMSRVPFLSSQLISGPLIWASEVFEVGAR